MGNYFAKCFTYIQVSVYLSIYLCIYIFNESQVPDHPDTFSKAVTFKMPLALLLDYMSTFVLLSLTHFSN